MLALLHHIKKVNPPIDHAFILDMAVPVVFEDNLVGEFIQLVTFAYNNE